LARRGAGREEERRDGVVDTGLVKLRGKILDFIVEG
jgi:hypothetical protein